MIEENLPMLLRVEDDPAEATLIMRSMKKAGIPARIVHLKDGDEAVAYLSARVQTGVYSLACRGSSCWI